MTTEPAPSLQDLVTKAKQLVTDNKAKTSLEDLILQLILSEDLGDDEGNLISGRNLKYLINELIDVAPNGPHGALGDVDDTRLTGLAGMVIGYIHEQVIDYYLKVEAANRPSARSKRWLAEAGPSHIPT